MALHLCSRSALIFLPLALLRVSALKQVLSGAAGVTASDQILLCNGLGLEDEHTLERYGLPSSEKRVFLFNKRALSCGAFEPRETMLEPVRPKGTRLRVLLYHPLLFFPPASFTCIVRVQVLPSSTLFPPSLLSPPSAPHHPCVASEIYCDPLLRLAVCPTRA